jgi:protein gp37
VFVNSMSDLFHEDIPDGYVAEVFDVMVRAEQHTFQILTKRHDRLTELASQLPWRRNIWMGVTIENRRFVHRADALREVPAAVRFISAEPLLSDLGSLHPGRPGHLDLSGIGWVIAGGESGPGYRAPDPAWFRHLRDRCTAAGIPFFFKQWGGPTPKAGGRLLDGRTWDEMPETATTRKEAA